MIEKLIAKSDPLKTFFNAIRVISPECRLHINKEGLYAIVVDFKNRVMVEARLNKFIFFDYDSDKETVIGVDVDHITRCLNALDKESDIELAWLVSKEATKLNILSGRASFSVNCPDIGTTRRDPNPPVITLNSTFSCIGSVFRYGVAVASIMSDACRIETTKTFCAISCEGDTTKFRYALSSEGTIPAKAKYATDILQDIMKVLGDSYISVKLTTDHPISLQSDEGYGLPHGLSVKYLIAPRIESD